MAGELIVAMYTVFLSEEWDTRLPMTLKRRLLSYNYSMPHQFEYDLDVVHKQVRERKHEMDIFSQWICLSSFPVVEFTLHRISTAIRITNCSIIIYLHRVVIVCSMAFVSKLIPIDSVVIQPSTATSISILD